MNFSIFRVELPDQNLDLVHGEFDSVFLEEGLQSLSAYRTVSEDIVVSEELLKLLLLFIESAHEGENLLFNVHSKLFVRYFLIEILVHSHEISLDIFEILIEAQQLQHSLNLIRLDKTRMIFISFFKNNFKFLLQFLRQIISLIDLDRFIDAHPQFEG